MPVPKPNFSLSNRCGGRPTLTTHDMGGYFDLTPVIMVKMPAVIWF